MDGGAEKGVSEERTEGGAAISVAVKDGLRWAIVRNQRCGAVGNERVMRRRKGGAKA
uniref:Uncharacterized protein n=1 Tax=Cucumis melo TaxID=3656 RepID=A0A9I9DPB0_CUCME